MSRSACRLLWLIAEGLEWCAAQADRLRLRLEPDAKARPWPNEWSTQ
jgi:hypothetical protein